MTEKEMRKLDAHLAGRVMGWRRVAKLNQLDAASFYLHTTDGVIIEEKGQSNRIKYFRPTTDAAAAMMVLEKCAKESSIPVQIIQGMGDGYAVVFTTNKRGETLHEGGAETLPLAIAKYSLALFSKK